ncbi:hypothetical protein [Candidatus Poriferisodalis sp.]|uniref:hypothetical protein n=1 Tax=Candidatus Poriferisodalis sp. TaxID=3101277 RepID=UPI003B5229D1
MRLSARSMPAETSASPMSAADYRELTNTDTPPMQKKKVQMWAWAPTVLLLIVLPNLMESLNVSRWFLTAPAAAVTGCIVIYVWVKDRRKASKEAVIRRRADESRQLP